MNYHNQIEIVSVGKTKTVATTGVENWYRYIKLF